MTTIMIVDDSAFARANLIELLAPEKYEIVTAESGEVALTLLHEKQVDVILLDVVMPGLNGYEVCERIKNDAQLGYIPVCLITSKDKVEDIVHGLEVGADEHISKPPNPDELRARIRVLIRLKKLRDNLRASNEALRKLNEELDMRVQLRTQQLENQNEELRKLEKLKTEFLANTSHELRTPLNAIIGYSEALFDGILGEINPAQKERLRLIQENAVHLLKLINELLDLAKARAGKLRINMAQHNYASVVSSAVDMVQTLAISKKMKIETRLPGDALPIVCDERRIRQVLLNLLSNAIKFSEQGVITVEVKDLDSEWLTTVKDEGIGIHPDFHQKIFEEFSQVSTQAEAAGGAGLGLPITHRIIQLHQGEIWVESETNKGSIFYYTLPKEPPPVMPEEGAYRDESARAESKPAPESNLPKPLLAVVEDDAAIREQVAGHLSSCKLFETVAGDARQLFKDRIPDYLVVNLLLKNRSSFDVIKSLDQRPPKIIAYSFKHLSERDCEYLKKTFDIQIILNGVIPEMLGQEIMEKIPEFLNPPKQ